MGKDPKQKQRKKAQKAAKHKSKKAEHKKQLAIRGTGVSIGLRGAFQAPISQCWEPSQLFHRNSGIGAVVITRKTEHHKILIGVFLLDVFCLGVKDAYVKLLSAEEFRQHLQQIQIPNKLKLTSPERARKLIEGAEAYARSIGFEPHKDYHTAKKIFGEIDAAACPDTFEFGSDGKPLYFAGPYDDRKFRERVINTLTEKLGPDGFHFVMPMGDDIPPSFFDEVEDPDILELPEKPRQLHEKR